MKRFLSVLITILLLLSLLPGCGEEEPQGPVTYEKPTFTPGTLQSDLLKVEPGNFDRANYTNTGANLTFTLLEIDSGYYYGREGLFFSEKDDMETWYYVCDDPSCAHSPNTLGSPCSATVCDLSFWYSDGRIYFTHAANLDPAFAKATNTMALFSMEKNGNDIRLEHAYQGLPLSGGSWQSACYVGGWLYAGQAMQPDGTYLSQIVWTELGGKETLLFERTFNEMVVASTTRPGLRHWSLYGDLSIGSELFAYTETGIDTLCWFRDGEPVFTNASEIPLRGGYLSDNIVRCFVPGDGYYDIDLLTGERTRLENAQLPQSKATILQPNCIIEATLLDRETTAQTQEMRFFDGQQWHSVELPEELRYATPDSFFAVQALMSDRVVFQIIKPGSRGNAWDLDATVIFYCMKLDAQEYKLEYMGSFQDPQWAISDIP